MADKLASERTLEEYLRGELRVLNAHLPRKQKPLSELLGEEHPHVICNDGSIHHFRRKELEYLAGLLDSDEQQALLLPMLIELSSDQSETATILGKEVEKKISSEILGMPATLKQTRIAVYRPQLALLRMKLRTTTQYVFSPGRH
ncbi:DUF61 family protein [Chloroflexota bacterium]